MCFKQITACKHLHQDIKYYNVPDGLLIPMDICSFSELIAWIGQIDSVDNIFNTKCTYFKQIIS